MNLTTIISKGIQNVSQLKTAALGVKEYCEKRLDDLRAFATNSSGWFSIPLAIDGESVLASVSKETFDALGLDEDVEVVVTKLGETRTVAAESVRTAFEQVTTDLTATSQLIASAFSGSLEKTTEFISRVTSKIGEVSDSVLKKYSSIVDYASDPVDLLRALFSQKASTAVENNQGLVVVSSADYAGSVAMTALSIIGDTFQSIFSTVFKGVRTIGDAFVAIGAGIIKFGTWLFHKVFDRLDTVYESAGNYPVGIFDVPVAQFVGRPLSRARILEGFNAATAAESDKYLTAWDGSARGYSSVDFDDDPQNINQAAVIERLLDLTSNRANEKWPFAVEMMLPDEFPYETNIGWALRFGSINYSNPMDSRWALQLYPVWKGGSIKNVSDEDVYTDMVHSLTSAIKSLSSIVPLSPGLQSVDDTSIRFNELRGCLLTDNVGNGAWAGATPSFTVSASAGNLSWQQWSVLLGMLLYVAAFSHILQTDTEDPDEPVRTLVMTGQHAVPVAPGSEDIVSVPTLDITPTWAAQAFVPFTTREFLPVAVHYQTTSEQAKEWISVIGGILVSAVVLTVSVSIAKKAFTWKRSNYLKEQQMRHAADVWINDPTPDNYKAYKKSRRQYVWSNAFGRMLGLTTTAATTTSVIPTLINSVTDDLSGSNGDNLDSIVRLIKG